MVLHFRYREAHKAPVRSLYRTLLRHCRHLVGYLPIKTVVNLRLELVARFREGRAQMNSHLVLDMLKKAHLLETQLRSAALGEFHALQGLKTYCNDTLMNPSNNIKSNVRKNPPPTGRVLQGLIEKQQRQSLLEKYLKSQTDRKMIPTGSGVSSTFKTLVVPQIVSKTLGARKKRKIRMLHTPFIPNLSVTHGKIAKYYFIRYPGGQNARLGKRISRMWKLGEKYQIKLNRQKAYQFYSQQQDAWDNLVKPGTKTQWTKVSQAENVRIASQASEAHKEAQKRKIALQTKIHDITLNQMDTALSNKRLLNLNFHPRIVKNLSKR